MAKGERERRESPGRGLGPAGANPASGKNPAAPAKRPAAARARPHTRGTTGTARGRPGKGVSRARPRPPASQVAWEWIRTLAGAFAIYFVVQAFLIQAFRIPSGSMEETLLVGDWLFVNKAIYGPKIPATNVHLPALSEPKQGGIVVFESPIEEGLNLVKRVIGATGDTLAMRGGQLIRNGRPQDEPYVQHTDPSGNGSDPRMSWQREYLVAGAVDPATYRPTRDDWGPVVVPPGRFFMMGDNRDASFDSRYYGFVRRDLIKGKPLFIYYSYDPRGDGPAPFLTHIRWSRIGHLIR
jgi:signal peptidase I